MPASRQISTIFFPSATSVLPHARKNSLAPPKVAAPKLRTETLRPEPPRRRYSMAAWMPWPGRGCRKNTVLQHGLRVLPVSSDARSFIQPFRRDEDVCLIQEPVYGGDGSGRRKVRLGNIEKDGLICRVRGELSALLRANQQREQSSAGLQHGHGIEKLRMES